MYALTRYASRHPLGRFWAVASVLVLAVVTAGCSRSAPTAEEHAAPAIGEQTTEQPAGDTRTIGVWQAPRGLVQTPIWPGGAPNMEGAPQAPESVLTAHTPEALEGDTSQAVFDVSVPTMTVFPPQGRNARAAVIVFPGGGFRAVVLTVEGTEICRWITARGLTCVLAKYRVPNSNHHWDETCNCAVTPPVATALQDAQRTIRLVRAQAQQLNIDPSKIGVMGFSAGGYLAVQTSNIFLPAYEAVDEIDRVSSRPDFAIAFFPGHLCRAGGTLDPGIRVTRQTPPTFLLQAWDDPVNDVCNSTVYARALNAAGVPSEVHLFATGGHAFGLRRNRSPDTAWPALVENWLSERGVL
jgi:acetyl esterase/lipase